MSINKGKIMSYMLEKRFSFLDLMFISVTVRIMQDDLTLGLAAWVICASAIYFIEHPRGGRNEKLLIL